ncbi:MAG: hypothetical protein U9R26_08110 [Campylobacterota bacterium]|nr:hypothetical protein [Campylobacterota bacterium]
MKKVIVLFVSVVAIVHAVELEKCDTCAANKEYVKCGHYVEMKGDLSYQNSCLLFAESIFEGNNYSRASWYYLLGGDFDNAIKAGEKSLEAKEYFVAELIAEAYVLKGDKDNAKKYFKLLKKRVPPEALFLKKHFEVLARLYPDKFDTALVVKLLQES